jgi:hypothetical protein
MYFDPERKLSYVALLSAPAAKDGRFVIDSQFTVWYVGETRFQQLLASRPQD